MLKKAFLVTAVIGLIAGTGAPVQAAEDQMTCREAAKMKHPDDLSARRAYMTECRAAFKSSQAAAEKPAAGPTYAGDL
jgi:hypothetical protein